MNEEEARTFRADNAGTTSRFEAEAETEVIVAQGFAEMSPEHQDWYDKAIRKRNRLAETVSDDMDMGDETWTWGASLRATWASAQQVDKSLAGYFRRHAEFPHNVRRAKDGVLEKLVTPKSRPTPIWVPIVPEGHVTQHLTWKKWVFLQLHIGIFGTHRNEKKTEQMILALAWWEKMSDDVKNWVKQCLTCIRFRQRPTKSCKYY